MTCKLAFIGLVLIALTTYSMEFPDKQEEWTPLAGSENERIFDRYWTPREETDNQNIYFNDDDAIKLVVPPLRYHFNPDRVTEKVHREEDEKQKIMDVARKPKRITPLPEIPFAKPKNEGTEKFIIKITNDDEIDVLDPCVPARVTKSTLKDKRWHYEVTESNTNDIPTATPTAQNSGYFYDLQPSKDKNEGSHIVMNTDKVNQTNILQNILSKYNINPNDKLKNYEVSRRTQMYFLPFRLNTPKRKQNRQNNLHVDPLIAVLLSNYGVYLPQFYKTNNGYKNLYGHLAFNNIHNNKPFGNYKLFSDTDYDYDDSLS